MTWRAGHGFGTLRLVPGVGARRTVAALVLAAATAAPATLFIPARATSTQPAAVPPGWVAAWGSAAAGPMAGNRYAFMSGGRAKDQTLREIVRPTATGTSVRIVLSNRFSPEALTVSAVTIAARDAGAAVQLGSMRVITFDGRPDVVIPPGSARSSDAVAFPVTAAQDLAVSISVPGTSAPATWHPHVPTMSYVTDQGAGDHTVDGGGAAFTHSYDSTVWLTRLDVMSTAPGGAVVALGDSLTEGWALTPDHNDRWTDVLAARLAALPMDQQRSVINAAISGNPVRPIERCDQGCGRGPPAGQRVDWDAFGAPGITTIIIFEGTNDLANGIGAQELEAGLTDLVFRARRLHLAVVMTTIPPWSTANPVQENRRLTVNGWIRASGLGDGVIDADALLRDPRTGHRLDPRFDIGDGIHFTPAAMKVVGDAIDVSVFNRSHRPLVATGFPEI